MTYRQSCVDTLSAYLDCVRVELERCAVTVFEIQIEMPAPQQALCASIVYLCPSQHPRGNPARAGWHEELGWWTEHPEAGHSRRYLGQHLAPKASAVAKFLTRSDEPGSSVPTLHRYRLLTGEHDLIAQLAQRTDVRLERPAQ